MARLCAESSDRIPKWLVPVIRINLEKGGEIDRSALVVAAWARYAEGVDEQGRPINADAPRLVTFAIDSGRGTLSQKEVEIPAGQFWARASFQPVWPGPVSVTASTPNLLTVTTNLDVSMPVALLLCSALGGLTGGVVSFLKTRSKSGQQRILIGLVTGFIFYWACIFLGLAALGPGVVLNPLSAFSLSTLGGWLQTEVFAAIWKILRPRAKA